MERFEYKLVATPCESEKYQGLTKADDAFAQTLGDGMNELGREGWQFMRTESVTEKRRGLFFIKKQRERNYMVYRRALRSNGMTLDEPVKSRRVTRAVPDSKELKSRISALVQDESQKKAVDKPIESPFQVIRSQLN